MKDGLSSTNEVSGRHAIISDEGDSVWLYLTEAGSERIVADCWLFNSRPALSQSEFDARKSAYRERGGPPPASAAVVKGDGRLEGELSERRVRIVWSSDGRSAAAWIDNEVAGYVTADNRRGHSARLAVECPWGSPLDRVAYDQIFRSEPATVGFVEKRLKRSTSPRLHMATIVGLTGLIGFLVSFTLLKAGVTIMAIRYPVAVLSAYAVFIGIVRLWLRRYRLRARTRDESTYSTALDVDVTAVPWSHVLDPTAPEPPAFGGGGGFSGGGSSRAFDGSIPSHGVAKSGGGGGGGGGGFDIDAEGAVVLLVLAVVAALASSMLLYVVWTAPTLFAELLLDVGLAAGLYRRLGSMPRRSWLQTAIRGTVIPAMIVLALVTFAGVVMQAVYPDAVSIGRVFDHMKKSDHSTP